MREGGIGLKKEGENMKEKAQGNYLKENIREGKMVSGWNRQ